MQKAKMYSMSMLIFALLFSSAPVFSGAEHSHKHEKNAQAHNETEHNQDVELSSIQQALAQIETSRIQKQRRLTTYYAPAELKENGYTSYLVAPRAESVVNKRYVALGQHVKKGDKLVSLYSETMAQAQADYIVAHSNWLRVKDMDNRTVSESEQVLAHAQYLASLGKLKALGLEQTAIEQLNTPINAKLGQYTLFAKIDGIVLKDDFAQGQQIAIGQTLLQLANEANLWVEARLAADENLTITEQTSANIQFAGNQYPAKVVQASHTIDPITRTRIIRLQVNNPTDKLHAGMFVSVYFSQPTTNPILAVPETALTRSQDGDWQVFIKEQSSFRPVEVSRGRDFGDYVEISGLKEGAEVVTQGAFFISSQLAKGSFDPHNH